MLVAIVPAGNKAWFFKVVAPGAAADELRKPFDEFLATVKADDAGDLPSWTLPAGWSAGPAREMVDATIKIPHGDESLEMTISSLPSGEDWAAFVKQNVDRWMGQLQEPSLSPAKIEKHSRKLPTANGEATAFELVGVMVKAPMAGAGGMPAGHPPVDATASAPPAADTAADDVDQQSSPPASPPAAKANFTYSAPVAWRPGPPSVMGFKREASFLTDGGGEVSVTAFAAGGQMADARANAQRWAGQVGMTDMSDEALAKVTSQVEIGGAAGQLFEFFSPAGAEPAQGIVAAMIVRGDRAWFFKLSGPKATIESQRAAFKEFLDSVKFTGDQ